MRYGGGADRPPQPLSSSVGRVDETPCTVSQRPLVPFIVTSYDK